MRGRYCLLAMLVLVSDQATKWIAQLSLQGAAPIEIIPGFLRFRHVLNSGVAFGLFQESQAAWKPYVFAGMAAVAVVVILIFAARAPSSRRLLQVALAITMGGILGNFIDRVSRGVVADFVEFHIHEVFYWPTFNLADAAITTGIALLLMDTLKNPAE